MRLGDLEILPLADGTFRLDGGAMFGIVPKPVWERRMKADERNRIPLALRPLLIRGPRTVLVDAGIGDKLDARQADLYGLDRRRHLDWALAAVGLTPADIDLVVATHLHFDHVGGFTVRDERGRLRPRFPRARYLIRRGEWEEATHPNERTRASYHPEDFLPLAEAGLVDWIDEDVTVIPGVQLRRTGGHTRHHQIVVVESAGRTAVFAADLIPTAAHVAAAWIMAYDLFPLETLAAKRALLDEAAAREALILFEHDPEVVAGRVCWRDGRWVVDPVLRE
jgi:glyoxylase-like metal-dependent hydrolase (beta-lactamase superfamily II)